MSLVSRIQRAVQAFTREPINYSELSKQLDTIAETKEVEFKELPSTRLDVKKTDHDLAYVSVVNAGFSFLRKWSASGKNKLPEQLCNDDPSIDYILCDMWKMEPILAGAIYSMTAKMQALKWSITGKRLHARNAASIFSRASYMGGFDWGGYIGSTAEDFYTLNRGIFTELAKDGDPLYAPLVDMGHIDALCCTLTGNSKYPMVYASETVGQVLKFKHGEFFHFASLPSSRERNLGSGMCAVSRAYRAAKLLIGLHDYDSEKLNNLPPEGVASVTGMTMDEFQDALILWKEKRVQDKSLTFPQVLWLIGSQPNAKVEVNFTGFSQMPEQFSRKEVVEQYINTLALCFGVDAREFWSINSGSLGSGAESEIQHLKAKGKGPGEFITSVERHLNGELWDDCKFSFDTQDIEEDANAAAIAKAWIDAYMPLYNLPKSGNTVSKENPRPNKPNGAPTLPTSPIPKVNTGGSMSINEGGQSAQAEQLISKDQFMRLLADKGVIPDWMTSDERVIVTDTEVHNRYYKEGHPDDTTVMMWENGVLKELRPVITLHDNNVEIVDNGAIEGQIIDVKSYDADESAIQALIYLKQRANEILEPQRNIRGDPIPLGEVQRGSMITRRAIHEEMERWRSNPVLTQYALTPEEEEALVASFKPSSNAKDGSRDIVPITSDVIKELQPNTQRIDPGTVIRQPIEIVTQLPPIELHAHFNQPEQPAITFSPNITVQPASSAPIEFKPEFNPNITVQPAPVTIQPAEPTPPQPSQPVIENNLIVPDAISEFDVTYDEEGKRIIGFRKKTTYTNEEREK
jgi:hypothetical protein